MLYQVKLLTDSNIKRIVSTPVKFGEPIVGSFFPIINSTGALTFLTVNTRLKWDYVNPFKSGLKNHPLKFISEWQPLY